MTALLRTALTIACDIGHDDNNKDLQKDGADMNAKDNERNTPAHILAKNRWIEPLKFLLTQKPNLDLKNKYGMTASEFSATIKVNKLFSSNSKLALGKNYTRTIIGQLLMHNNRVDTIKSIFFKRKLINSQQYDMEEIKTQTRKIKDKRHFMRIIEAVRKIHSIYEEKNININLSGNESIGPHYFLPLQLLGKGSYGEVYLVKYKPTGKMYAMKVMNKEQFIDHNLMKYAFSEKNVLANSKHPFIVGLDFAFQTSKKLFLILEYCPGYHFINL